MKRLLATLLLLAATACQPTTPPVTPAATATASATVGAIDTVQPVFTATATRTMLPTWTMQPTYTMLPTSTMYPVQATYTPYPTYTQPPTFTPTPTATMRSEGQRVPRARVLPVGVASYADGVCWPKYYYSESSEHETRITEDVAGFRMCVAMVGAGQRKALK